jgi:hypothetical protein
MAVRYIEVPIDIRDIEDEDEGVAVQSHALSTEGINLGAFRGLAFALAIEATVAGLGWGLWQILR